jgi:Zn-dependent protease
MRDLMSWGVSLPRMFGIPVKVHWLFFVVTIGLFLRQVGSPTNLVWWGDVFLLTVALTFAVILLHELGHCLAGRLVGGEPKEILLWPLGGLASVDVPQTPKATFLTAAGGPAVNAVLLLISGMVLAVGGYVPNPNPFANPYTAELRKPKDGRVYGSDYTLKLYKPGTAEPVEVPAGLAEAFNRKDWAEVDRQVVQGANAEVKFERARLTGGMTWAYRLFWLNLVLLLINLLPAYPLDGGQMLLSVIWARTDYRQGVAVAAYSGFVVAILILILSIAANESLLMGLAVFMLVSAVARLNAADADDAGFGDFSQGYTSYERDEDRPPPPKPVSPWRKWLQARAARRILREQEALQADDARMDQLLDKIAHAGKQSLTDEERRFMERMSARYRNR